MNFILVISHNWICFQGAEPYFDLCCAWFTSVYWLLRSKSFGLRWGMCKWSFGVCNEQVVEGNTASTFQVAG